MQRTGFWKEIILLQYNGNKEMILKNKLQICLTHRMGINYSM